MSEASHCLIDSNVLIYMHDDKRASHQKQAVDIYRRLVESNRSVLSTQCLVEFFNAVTRKLRDPLSIAEAVRRLNQIADTAVVYPVTLDIVKDAAIAAEMYQMSIWDAQIWAVAFRNGVPIVVTEDMQSQPIIAGVRYINPFDPAFDIQSL
ncbi:MAG TPA: PIN domain-containing protein [Thermomicrobiales bacterium]|nr:PIN domain-containing protein [Thermomicrobiales bacterium]